MNDFSATTEVWKYGNPLTRKSYASAFDDWDTAQVLQTVISRLFWQSKPVWDAACKIMNVDVETLERVALLEIEAKRMGIKDVQSYIGARIDRSRYTVSRMLDLLDMREMESHLASFAHIEQNFDVGIEGIETWKPSRRDIQREMAAVPRRCAAGYPGCHDTTPNGRYPLCSSCHQIVKDDEYPAWLQSEIRRIGREHRKEAIDRLYLAQRGEFSLHDYEEILLTA